MTSRVFLPDYGHLPTREGNRPMFTLYQGEPLKLCFYRDGHRYFPTPAAAREAAKEYVAGLINRIRTETASDEPEPSIDLGQSTWLAEKAERDEAERQRVFGTDRIFRKGREIAVETRRRRA